MSAAIRHIFVSPGHNFFGRHGRPAGEHPVVDVTRVMCRAGRGLEGDRFFGYRPDYSGQVTFFAWEVYQRMTRELGVPDVGVSAVRRNVVTVGVELNELIGRRFVLGGIEFEGTGEARPCYWMNRAVAPGAEEWLKGHGGLRAKILTDGELTVGPVELWLHGGTQAAFSFTAPKVW